MQKKIIRLINGEIKDNIRIRKILDLDKIKIIY